VGAAGAGTAGRDGDASDVGAGADGRDDVVGGRGAAGGEDVAIGGAANGSDAAAGAGGCGAFGVGTAGRLAKERGGRVRPQAVQKVAAPGSIAAHWGQRRTDGSASSAWAVRS
jgi:hypothetical protein